MPGAVSAEARPPIPPPEVASPPPAERCLCFSVSLIPTHMHATDRPHAVALVFLVCFLLCPIFLTPPPPPPNPVLIIPVLLAQLQSHTRIVRHPIMRITQPSL